MALGGAGTPASGDEADDGIPESEPAGCAASGPEGPEGTAPSSEGPKGAAPGSEEPEGTTGDPEGTAPGQKVKCRLVRLRIPILGMLVLPSPLEIRLLADLMEWSRERERA